MDRPSLHLSWDELACRDGTPYPRAWADRAAHLAAVFEDLRAALGGDPIQIGSAYRTARHNRRCGGGRRSQHLQGRALDCTPPAAMFLHTFRAAARHYADHDLRIGGIGLYRWGVHIDTRPRHAGRLVVWNRLAAGTRIHDTLTQKGPPHAENNPDQRHVQPGL